MLCQTFWSSWTAEKAWLLRSVAFVTQRLTSKVMLHKFEARGSKLALVTSVVFLLVGIGGVVGSWSAYNMDTEIERKGPRAMGLLVKKHFLRAADGDSDYILEYTFTTSSGQEVKASRGVSKELWASLREGALLEVRYSAVNPKRNFPAGAGVTSLGVTIFVSAVASVFAVFGGALVWGFFRHAGISA